MKSPILLACALMTAITLGGMAKENAADGEGGKAKQVKRERPERGPMTPERKKAMMDKRMERIKEKDEALYKELSALREKDPEAFDNRMREMAKARIKERQQQRKEQGVGEGKGRGRGPKADQPKTEK